MTELEGVIKYQLHYVRKPLPSSVGLADLNHWRGELFRLGLIGQDPRRYGGLGFGNMSCRWPRGARSFLVTASQTGHLSDLGLSHYAWVTDWDVHRNELWAEGETQPSSESISHSLLYELSSNINAVVHVHSPEMWMRWSRLGLAGTPEHCSYGTPALAESIRTLYRQGALSENPVFVMRGHEDGVLSFGGSLGEAVTQLLSVHAQALRLSA